MQFSIFLGALYRFLFIRSQRILPQRSLSILVHAERTESVTKTQNHPTSYLSTKKALPCLLQILSCGIHSGVSVLIVHTRTGGLTAAVFLSRRKGSYSRPLFE